MILCAFRRLLNAISRRLDPADEAAIASAFAALGSPSPEIRERVTTAHQVFTRKERR